MRIVPYDSIVCVKQVPDTANVTGEAMKADGTVNRAALPAIFNPEDVHALEAALQLRDERGGTVTVITMGPPRAADVLRDCLYRGADRVILITDRRAAASDTLATSYILSQTIRAIGRYDFVFCGRQAIDGDTAQVGPQCAEKLGITQVTYMERIADLTDRTVRIRRNVGNGWEIVEARAAAAKRVMRFKRARVRAELAAKVADQLRSATEEEQETEVERRAEALRSRGLLMEQWDLDDMEADLARCGLSGSPTKVHRVQAIVLTKEGYTEVPPTEAGIRQMVHELVVDHTLG
jgi:electron transfer flavoprotein beta subunit